MSLLKNSEKIVCPMCKRIAINLVPLYDDDQAHKKQLACHDCKKKIKAGLEIIKYERDNNYLDTLEREMIKRVRG